MTSTPVGSNGLPSPWTDERVALLTKLWADGYAASFIAVQIGEGLTKNAIVGKAKRLGLEKRREGTQPSFGSRQYAPRPPREDNTAWRPFLGITLLDLEPTHCRYPKGESEFLFCGQAKQAGSSYCSHHHAICNGRSPPEQRNKFAATWRAA